MGYYDDDNYEYIDEYHDSIEPVELVSEAFSEKSITCVLETAGLVSEKSPKYAGNMERLVFVYGDDKEVYSSDEIRYTEKIDCVYMYSDFNKFMRRGAMVCRVIATKIEAVGHDAVTSCVAFEKIVNKALDGFNIFFFVTDDSVFFGCRVFDKNGKYDCALSNPIREEYQFEQILDEFAYTADVGNFMDYYGQVRSIISCDQDDSPSYEDILIRRRGIRQSYLDNLDAIENTLGVSFSKEKERYCSMFSDAPEESFVSLLDRICESLAFIKSNRINTYEMLFEADEVMHWAEQVEAENERMAIAAAQENNETEDVTDDEACSLLDNPEEMIKLLKKRRGL
ncbi:MAG: hypothetical protein K2K63_07035 [Acetatifactor sp.]|nr:hypothetical protein [Acetatifactor sp.]